MVVDVHLHSDANYPKPVYPQGQKSRRHRKLVILKKAIVKMPEFQTNRHSDNGADLQAASPRNCAFVTHTGATSMFATLSTTTPQNKTMR